MARTHLIAEQVRRIESDPALLVAKVA